MWTKRNTITQRYQSDVVARTGMQGGHGLCKGALQRNVSTDCSRNELDADGIAMLGWALRYWACHEPQIILSRTAQETRRPIV